MAGLFPDFRVRLDGGAEYDVVTKFSDGRAWELYAAAHGIEPASAPFSMGGFFAWRHARKQGLCGQDEDMDLFCDRIDNLEVIGQETVDPTRPAPGDG